MKRSPTPRYRAFLSYSHKDSRPTNWLHARIEGYRIPSRLIGKVGSEGVVPERLLPVFMDRRELAASGSLSAELDQALASSRFLIVVCSPATPLSPWVNEEIRLFKRYHGEGHVLALVVAGEPGASAIPGREAEECFPPALRFRLDASGNLTDTPAEPIAADIRPHADGKRLALLKLVAALAGLRLDDLIQREAQRRIRRLTAIIAASAVGLLVTASLAVYAETQRRRAEQQATTAEAAVDYLVGMFEIVDSGTENPNTVTAVSLLERSAHQAATRLQYQPAIRLRIADTMGRVYNNLGLYKESEAALHEVEPLLAQSGIDGVPGLLTLATSRLNRGDLKGADRIIKGIESRFEASAPPLLLRARTARLTGDLQSVAADQAGAIKAYAEAVRLYSAATNATPRLIADAATSQGVLLTDMARYDEAEEALARANQLYRSALGDKHRLTGISYNALAYNEFSAGQFEKSRANIAKALAIFEVVLDDSNPTLAGALALRGQIEQQAGDLGAAKQSLEQAIRIYDARFGGPHYLTGIALVSLAGVEADLGRIDRAMADFAWAKRNYDIGYGGEHANHGDLLINRALVQRKAGRMDAAARDCRDGLKILDATLGSAAGYTLRMKAICTRLLGSGPTASPVTQAARGDSADA
jgi:tetratricopeptide (TPR) repeat protein